jgi:hypothetical protein
MVMISNLSTSPFTEQVRVLTMEKTTQVLQSILQWTLPSTMKSMVSQLTTGVLPILSSVLELHTFLQIGLVEFKQTLTHSH